MLKGVFLELFPTKVFMMIWVELNSTLKQSVRKTIKSSALFFVDAQRSRVFFYYLLFCFWHLVSDRDVLSSQKMQRASSCWVWFDNIKMFLELKYFWCKNITETKQNLQGRGVQINTWMRSLHSCIIKPG